MSDKGSVHSEFSHWELPDVTHTVDDDMLDMFGRQQVIMAAEIEDAEEEEGVLPPTLSEIEGIRQEAEQAGFEHGKAAGFGEGFEKGQLTGLEQGHKEGFSQGQDQGLADGMKQAQAHIDQFEALLTQFTQPLALLDTDIELQLISLVDKLSQAVIMHELTLAPEQIAHVLRHGLDALPIKKQTVTIRVNPSDAKVIALLYSHTEQERQGWHLEEDPTLTQGGLIMHCEPSQLDLTLESRLKAVFSEWQQTQAVLEQNKQQQQEQRKQQEQSKQQLEAQQLAVLDDEIHDRDFSEISPRESIE
ncbi:flagellar assembly protein FliH [Shewanella surugensis]|uniref:Flagellar assembly protein FliH n=1 Tax=Shewanella surugensis TaxID=212020 RepID=A0ABT0LA53_9GAMM|nr:flagellar assembly protein FliH [Shewanella surugensis]MCL1124365.1 flagellar assembly protein FliH [Shewanella surugensis]